MEELKLREETKKEIARKLLKMGTNEIKIYTITGLSIKKIKALKSEGLSEEEKSIMLFDLKEENEEIKNNVKMLEKDISILKRKISKFGITETNGK